MVEHIELRQLKVSIAFCLNVDSNSNSGSNSSSSEVYRIISCYTNTSIFFEKMPNQAFKTAQVTAELAAIVALQNSDGLQWKLSYHCLEKEHWCCDLKKSLGICTYTHSVGGILALVLSKRNKSKNIPWLQAQLS